MFSISLLLAWSVLFTFSQASPPYTNFLQKRTSGSIPLPPSVDPFYTGPTNYQLAAPGAVLRVREAPGNLTSVIGNCSAAYNILYRTTDSQYLPTWAVTTLLVPLSQPNTTSIASNSTSPGGALLSYQIAYDSADIDASPSYTLYGGVVNDITDGLGSGWFVNVPDYDGPLGSDVAGVQSGHATLDSVRAVLSSGFGLSSNPRYVMWGYSGGALASEWAAELQVQYAPELNFSGVVLGGLTPNVTNVLETINGTPAAGLAVSGLLGLTSQYPAAYEFLIQQLKTSGPYNRTGFLAAKNMTIEESNPYYANQDVFAYFTNGSAILQAPVLQKAIYADGLMGYHGVPQMPLFVYKAIHDEISPIGDTDALVDKYCTVGVSILYQRNSVGGHGADNTNGAAMATEWVTSALNGTLQQTGCLIQNVTMNVTDSPI